MTNEELKKLVGRNVRKYRLIYNAYNKEKLIYDKQSTKCTNRKVF